MDPADGYFIEDSYEVTDSITTNHSSRGKGLVVGTSEGVPYAMAKGFLS